MTKSQGGRSSREIGIDRMGKPVYGRTAPTPDLKRYTLQRNGDRPIQFDGDELVSVESRGSPTTHRAAIYRTRGGKFIVEFSSRPSVREEALRRPRADELAEFRETFIQKVIDTAEWREGKAVQFPRDARNLQSLADQRWVCLWLAQPQEQALSELIRQYGYYGSPDKLGPFLDALGFLDAAIHIAEASGDEQFDVAAAGKAAVFDSLDEALKWFRPGPLTTELLKKLGKLEPEFIE